MSHPSTTAKITINTPIDTAFEYIVPVDLSLIFKRYKIFPAVTHTDEKAKWITPGLTRTVFFDDGTTAKETLLTVVDNESFSYEVQYFTSSLRFLAKKIEGNWSFKTTTNGTHIEWTYTIIPKHFLARFIIKTFLLKNVHQLLSNALNILKTNLENEHSIRL